MEVGELMAFKPVTAPKRPAHKEEIQGTLLIIIRYPMLNIFLVSEQVPLIAATFIFFGYY